MVEKAHILWRLIFRFILFDYTKVKKLKYLFKSSVSIFTVKIKFICICDKANWKPNLPNHKAGIHKSCRVYFFIARQLQYVFTMPLAEVRHCHEWKNVAYFS